MSFRLTCVHDGTALPLPLAGRGIAYEKDTHGIEACERALFNGCVRHSRFDSDPFSIRFRPASLPQQRDARPSGGRDSRISICDSPALAGEGWGGGAAAIRTVRVERVSPTRIASFDAMRPPPQAGEVKRVRGRADSTENHPALADRALFSSRHNQPQVATKKAAAITATFRGPTSVSPLAITSMRGE
jgi:hypothetical protein